MTGVRTEGRSVVARMERSSSSVKVAEPRGEAATDGAEVEEAIVDRGVVEDGKVAVHVREEFLGRRGVGPLEDRIMITEGSDGGKGCREAECEEVGGFPAARPLTRDPELLLPRGKGEGELALGKDFGRSVGRSGEDDEDEEDDDEDDEDDDDDDDEDSDDDDDDEDEEADDDDDGVWGRLRGRVVCGKITSGSVERGMSTGMGLGQTSLGPFALDGETNVISGGGTSSVKTMEDDLMD